MNFAFIKSHLMVIATENINFIVPAFGYLEHKANFIKQINSIVQAIPVRNNRTVCTKLFTLSRTDWHAKLVIIYPFYRTRQKPYKNYTLFLYPVPHDFSYDYSSHMIVKQKEFFQR